MTGSVIHRRSDFFVRSLLIAAVLAVSVGPFIWLRQANAAAATGYLRLDRMAASATGTATTGGTICMTPETAGTVAKVLITFPGNGTQAAASFGVNSTASNWTLATANIPTGATQWPGIGTNPSGVSGAVVTVNSSTLSTGTQYCFTFAGTTTLSNPTSANANLTGSIQTQTSGNAPIDTVNFSTAIITNDQISVTATVPSTFSFSLNSNSAALNQINTTGATSATAITGQVSTNANNGWLAWVKSTNAALSSPSTLDTIPSAAYTSGSGNIVDLSSTSGYVLDVQQGSGTPTIATEYLGNGSSSGGNLSTSFRQIASKSTPASANAFTMTVRARATATNKAATDYADTLTVTAAGQF